MSRFPVTEFHWALLDIASERDAQDKQWGGPEHDDAHDPRDWTCFIDGQRLKAFYEYHDPFAYESRMLKIAALAVAAIESSRRKRHAERPPAPAPDQKHVIYASACETCRVQVHASMWNGKCSYCGGTSKSDVAAPVAERPHTGPTQTDGVVVNVCTNCGGERLVIDRRLLEIIECPSCSGSGKAKE